MITYIVVGLVIFFICSFLADGLEGKGEDEVDRTMKKWEAELTPEQRAENKYWGEMEKGI